MTFQGAARQGLSSPEFNGGARCQTDPSPKSDYSLLARRRWWQLSNGVTPRSW